MVESDIFSETASSTGRFESAADGFEVRMFSSKGVWAVAADMKVNNGIESKQKPSRSLSVDGNQEPIT